jgi:hypothetical protein
MAILYSEDLDLYNFLLHETTSKHIKRSQRRRFELLQVRRREPPLARASQIGGQNGAVLPLDSAVAASRRVRTRMNKL